LPTLGSASTSSHRVPIKEEEEQEGEEQEEQEGEEERLRGR
jgi:hypothetical protein